MFNKEVTYYHVKLSSISTVLYIPSNICKETEELYTDYYAQTLQPSMEVIPHIHKCSNIRQCFFSCFNNGMNIINIRITDAEKNQLDT